MKKFFSFMVMSLVALLPFSVDAATEISPSCGSKDADGNITCTISYNITDPAGADSLTVTLTEQGGADIISVENAIDTDWAVSSQNESNGVWTILLASPGVAGEGNLFTFTYKTSGTTDCKIKVALDGQTTEIIPEEPTPDNPKTGASFPYIALGAVALIAVGAYVATKNKAKMYRI